MLYFLSLYPLESIQPECLAADRKVRLCVLERERRLLIGFNVFLSRFLHPLAILLIFLTWSPPIHHCFLSHSNFQQVGVNATLHYTQY